MTAPEQPLIQCYTCGQFYCGLADFRQHDCHHARNLTLDLSSGDGPMDDHPVDWDAAVRRYEEQA